MGRGQARKVFSIADSTTYHMPFLCFQSIQCYSNLRRQWNYGYRICTLIYIDLSHISNYPKILNITK
jgi:hypothetical protein